MFEIEARRDEAPLSVVHTLSMSEYNDHSSFVAEHWSGSMKWAFEILRDQYGDWSKIQVEEDGSLHAIYLGGLSRDEADQSSDVKEAIQVLRREHNSLLNDKD